MLAIQSLEQAPLEPARRVEQEDDPAPSPSGHARRRPRGVADRRSRLSTLRFLTPQLRDVQRRRPRDSVAPAVPGRDARRFRTSRSRATTLGASRCGRHSRPTAAVLPRGAVSAGIDDAWRCTPRHTARSTRGRPARRSAAFFDLDRTLIAGFSACRVRPRRAARPGASAPRGLARAASPRRRASSSAASASRASSPRRRALLKGVAEARAACEVGERLFTRDRSPPRSIPRRARSCDAHRRKRPHAGGRVVGARRYQIEPLARDLGIEHVLCTRLEVTRRALHRRRRAPLLLRRGQARSPARDLADAARRRSARRASSTPTATRTCRCSRSSAGRGRRTRTARSRAIAARRGWPARRFTSRGPPSMSDVVRTSLAVGEPRAVAPARRPGGAPGGAAGGAAINLARQHLGRARHRAGGHRRLRCTGEEHLWSHRPAVFIFNHQSAIDVLMLCKLLRRDFVGIGKQEVRRNPIFGPASSRSPARSSSTASTTTQADRGAGARRRGAPRGPLDRDRARGHAQHRRRGSGAFKKGAFHIAMAAGVPIVPIVFRNTLDALPKHGIVAAPGHGRGGGASADPDRHLDAQGPRSPHRRGVPAVRADPRRVGARLGAPVLTNDRFARGHGPPKGGPYGDGFTRRRCPRARRGSARRS